MTMPLPPDLITGHEVIDQQHANIITYLSKMLSGEMDARLAFSLLLDHFTSHFGLEEELMEETEYPDRYMHKLEHMNFFDVFVNLRAKYDMAPTQENRDLFVSGIQKWVVAHVLDKDKRMAVHVRYIKSRT